ncbi:MAG: caspase family protein [Humidesulfovibrio sp.]|nr:caspase family protein [Humidesulfovibrio sp.]
MRRTIPLVVVLTFLGLGLASPAQAERRTALVIGNGAYKTASLKNPTNDAQDMAAALSEMGFDVTLKLNASLKDMEEAVRTFGVKLKQGGLGLFYYAGHGVQMAGENYLIPVDTKVEAEADVKFGALNAGMALARMEDAGNDLNIVILDACRTNPFARNFRTVEQGLARMDAPRGSLIAYATAPGRVAADSGSSGRNGVYTGFLLRHMRDPGLKVEEVLKRVRADVVRATKDKQVPWESSSLIGDFYFTLPQGQLVQASPTAHPIAPPLPDGLLAGYGDTLPDVAPRPQMASSSVTVQLTPVPSLADQTTNTELQPQTESEKWFDDGLLKFYKGNYPEAERLYLKAAEQGHARAQLRLGNMYSQSQGIRQDFREAVKWYRKASEQENAEAQFDLGVMYHKGQGVPQNYSEALKWYSKAAKQGYDKAQGNLAVMYAVGQGIQKNNVLAYMWFSLAAAQGNANAAKGRDLAASEMKPAQLAEAQRLAANWRPKKPEEGKAAESANADDSSVGRGTAKRVASKK